MGDLSEAEEKERVRALAELLPPERQARLDKMLKADEHLSWLWSLLRKFAIAFAAFVIFLGALSALIRSWFNK